MEALELRGLRPVRISLKAPGLGHTERDPAVPLVLPPAGPALTRGAALHQAGIRAGTRAGWSWTEEGACLGSLALQPWAWGRGHMPGITNAREAAPSLRGSV